MVEPKDWDIEDHFRAMKAATALLKGIRESAEWNGYQFGEPGEFIDLVGEIRVAQDTWIQSNC